MIKLSLKVPKNLVSVFFEHFESHKGEISPNSENTPKDYRICTVKSVSARLKRNMLFLNYINALTSNRYKDKLTDIERVGLSMIHSGYNRHKVISDVELRYLVNLQKNNPIIDPLNPTEFEKTVHSFDITPFVNEMNIFYPKMKQFIKDYMADVPQEYFKSAKNLAFYNDLSNWNPKERINITTDANFNTGKSHGIDVEDYFKRVMAGELKENATIEEYMNLVNS